MAGPATGFLIAGLGLQAITSAASFIQAGQSKREMRDAESKAEAIMRDARRRLDVNFYEPLAIKKEPYELQREAMLQTTGTMVDALREGDPRGLAAGVGRIKQAEQKGQGATRSAMSKEQGRLEELVAKEDSRLRDLNVQLDLGEIQGQQAAAADAEKRAAAQMQSGIAGAAGALQSGLQLIPLYQQQTQLQQAALGNAEFSDEQLAASGLTRDQFEGIPDLSRREFRQLRRGLTDTQRLNLFGNKSYQDQYALGLSAGFGNTLDPNQNNNQNNNQSVIQQTGPRGASYVEGGNLFEWDVLTQQYINKGMASLENINNISMTK
tara:strand:- start:255 stop:1223 length:969 start_codon:yes stop_codon:yes gene_type:complete